MKLTALFAVLALLAAPVAAASLDRFTATGVTSGPIEGSASYDFGGLFVDDDLGVALSIFLPLTDEGSFDPADTTTSDLLYFPDATLDGALVDVEYGDSTIFALFKVDSDSFDGTPWGSFVRATIALTAVDWNGGVNLNDLGGFGSPTGATTTLDGLSPIPLPGTLPLLMVALGLGAVIRRHT